MQVDLSNYQKDIEALRRLWEAAHLDPLTKLYNRYGMENWIAGQLESIHDGACPALLMIDVDNFKNINDSYGHMMGDAILTEIADIIRNLFREDFRCGRVGGDEYQIFSLKVSRKVICDKAERLCRLIEARFKEQSDEY